MNKRSDLSKFNNQNYNPGNIIVRSLWYLVNILFFKSSLFPIYFLKVSLLNCLEQIWVKELLSNLT